MLGVQHVPPCQIYVMLWMDCRALCMLGKHSTDLVMSSYQSSYTAPNWILKFW